MPTTASKQALDELATPPPAARSENQLPGKDRGGVSRPLPDDERAKMEGAWGVDLSEVRMEENASAVALGADAYATGKKIVFAPGKLDAQSAEGRRLMRHESFHLTQPDQGAAGELGVQEDPSLEAEADRKSEEAADKKSGGGEKKPLGAPRAIRLAKSSQVKSSRKELDQLKKQLMELVVKKERSQKDEMQLNEAVQQLQALMGKVCTDPDYYLAGLPDEISELAEYVMKGVKITDEGLGLMAKGAPQSHSNAARADVRLFRLLSESDRDVFCRWLTARAGESNQDERDYVCIALEEKGKNTGGVAPFLEQTLEAFSKNKVDENKEKTSKSEERANTILLNFLTAFQDMVPIPEVQKRLQSQISTGMFGAGTKIPLTVLDEAKFGEAVYQELLWTNKDNSELQHVQHFSVETVLRWQWATKVDRDEAFFSQRTGKLMLRKGRVQVHQVVHEAIHSLGGNAIRLKMGAAMNEAATEMITLFYLKNSAETVQLNAYVAERKLLNMLLSRAGIGIKELCTAYFLENVDVLLKPIAASKSASELLVDIMKAKGEVALANVVMNTLIKEKITADLDDMAPLLEQAKKNQGNLFKKTERKRDSVGSTSSSDDEKKEQSASSDSEEMAVFEAVDTEQNRSEGELGKWDKRYDLTEAQVKLLKATGLKLTGTAPNGDCMFNAVSESANFGADAKTMREAAAKWVETNEETIRADRFSDLSKSEGEKRVRSICKKLRTPHCYDDEHGDLALEAMSAQVGVGINVIFPGGEINTPAEGPNPVTIFYVDGPHPHYYGSRPGK